VEEISAVEWETAYLNGRNAGYDAIDRYTVVDNPFDRILHSQHWQAWEEGFEVGMSYMPQLVTQEQISELAQSRVCPERYRLSWAKEGF
jgi:hypothetical protein